MSLAQPPRNRQKRASRRKKLAKEVRKEVKKEVKKDVKKNVRRIRQRRTTGLRGPISAMSPMLKSYCDAVVNPFGNDALGAMLPDGYQQHATPATDRIETDISPDFFNFLTSQTTWQDAEGYQLVGAAFWLMPRCGASGMFTSETVSSNTRNTYPFYPLNTGATAIEASPPMNAYNLCMTGVWNVEDGTKPDRDWGFFYGEDANPDNKGIFNTYYMLPYAKFSSIVLNTAKLRIVGAGLKLWSEEAPINTGGYAMGGWLTIDDLYAGLHCVSDDAASPAFFHTVQPLIKDLVRNPGLDGVTVRYNPIQDDRQSSLQYAEIPARQVTVQNIGTTKSPYIYTEDPSISFSVSDLVAPGSSIPFVIWMFNASSVNDTYTLKLSSVVHTETVPNGINPFGTTLKRLDPHTPFAKMMLEDLEVWPAATKGHSFRSFMSKAAKVSSDAYHIASDLAGIMSLANKVYAPI